MAAEASSLGAAAVKGVRQFVRLSSAATPSNGRKRSTVDEAITARDGARIFYRE
jgi:hypothetical protein